MGIVTIYSANYDIAAEHAGGLPSRQLLWLGLGLAVMFTTIAFDYHYVDRLAYPFYGLMLVLLILVFFVGHAGGGSQRWINLGFFRLQPSEPAKLAIVLVMAKYFQDSEPSRGYCLRDLWAPFALVAPLIGLTLIQPDLGTAIILGLVFMSMMLIGGLRIKSFLGLAAAGLGFLPIAWNLLWPYQRARVLTFFDPDRDPLAKATCTAPKIGWISCRPSIPTLSLRCFPKSGALPAALFCSPAILRCWFIASSSLNEPKTDSARC
jgi:rod shape determining protein RodA